MDSVFLVAALLYAVLFWSVGWKHPGVALALVFGTAPFQNDLSAGAAGVKFSFAEVNLVLSLPLLAILLINGERRLRMWPLFWPCVAFSLACIASALTVWRPGSAPTAFVQQTLFFFVVVPLFALLPRRAEELKIALWSLLLVGTFLSVAALLMRSHNPDQPGVFGINKNGLGGSLSCALIVALEVWFHEREKARLRGRWSSVTLKDWFEAHAQWFAAFALVGTALGLLITLSRGGWLAAFGGVAFLAAMRRQFVLLGRLVLVLVPCVALAWNLLPQEQREYATSFSAKRGNIKQRFINSDNALAQWRKNYVFGSGMGLRKEMDATNFVLTALAETGIVGLVTFLALFGAFYAMILRGQQGFSRAEFGYSLFAIGGALMLSRLLHGLVDHYWARGPTMMAWASAGMATGALWLETRAPFAARLRRARALLGLHLLESRRRARRGAPPIAPSRAELLAARDAFARARRGAAPGNPRSSRPLRPTEKRDPLAEMARDLGDRSP